MTICAHRRRGLTDGPLSVRRILWSIVVQNIRTDIVRRADVVLRLARWLLRPVRGESANSESRFTPAFINSASYPVIGRIIVLVVMRHLG